MRIGIFGSEHDAQCTHLAGVLKNKGVRSVLVESQALNCGVEHSFDGEHFSYKGENLSDVCAWYMRYVMAPYPPAFQKGEEFHLFDDWFLEYMRRRENFSYQLSWLLSLSKAGVPVVNRPENGSVLQLKLLQLSLAKALGLIIPKTLISNSPEKVLEFERNVGEVVYKPVLGGGHCDALNQEVKKRLHLLTRSPVIFQEHVKGLPVRLTLVGNEIVSSAAILTTKLDYRTDLNYQNGAIGYERVSVPKEIEEKTIALLSECGLCFSGVDFLVKADGSWVFLEANSSPMYLEIEMRLKDPITERLADYLVSLVKVDDRKPVHKGAKPKERRSFAEYVLPFRPDIAIG